MGVTFRFMPIKSFLKIDTLDEFVPIYDTYLSDKKISAVYPIEAFKSRPSIFPVYIIRTTNGYRIWRGRDISKIKKYANYLDYTNGYKIQRVMDL